LSDHIVDNACDAKSLRCSLQLHFKIT
jgi:hypothetical protein